MSGQGLLLEVVEVVLYFYTSRSQGDTSRSLGQGDIGLYMTHGNIETFTFYIRL